MTETPPQGWYPDEHGTVRWWDGTQWTEHTQEPAHAGPQASAAVHSAASAKASRPWFKKKRVIIPAALVGVLVIGSALGSGSGDDDPAEASDTSPSTSQEKAADDTSAERATKKTPEKPSLTAGQQNAVRSAKQYLEISGFSRRGLIEQLSSDAGSGFPSKDATYAADHVGADWKEQAVRSAKQYLEISGFSRDGLIEQLTSDAGSKFTRAEAEYAASEVGL